MKTTIVIILLTLTILIVLGVFTKLIAKIETQKYETIFKNDDFEIRYYPEAVFATVEMDGSYDNIRNSGFRILAGYIFGGNKVNEKIAMTSPVRMGTDEKENKMSFVIPSKYELDDLPTPNDKRIELHNSVAIYTASIRFGGYANNSTIEKKERKLYEMLNQLNIKHRDKTQYLGYNSPYDMVNRRNEVLVELIDFNPQKLKNIAESLNE